MKVVPSIRKLHDERKSTLEELKSHVDSLLAPYARRKNWLYFGRLKSLESFALKYESQGERAFEDLFACTLVVNSPNEKKTAEEELVNNFGLKLRYKRPKKETFTFNDPENFKFDELRLYVKVSEDPRQKKKIYTGQMFEIQIKTFLSHAWSEATHKIIYKGRDYSWGRSRVAFQIKAALEQAEYAISNLNSTNDSFFPNSRLYETKNNVIAILKNFWPPERLPEDLVRCAGIIHDFLELVGDDCKGLSSKLEVAQSLGRGSELHNLSPYMAVVQTYIDKHSEMLEHAFRGKGSAERKLLLVDELEIKASLREKLSN